MKRIEVAVGIVFNSQDQVLVGQRTIKDQYFNKWEFPGGKLEADESPSQALARELEEEIGIKVLASNEFIQLEHDYPDRKVKLYVHRVTSYTGSIVAMEGQALQWLALQDLDKLDFLEGNQSIIEQLLSRALT